jgi:PTH1 family peptidyl-tRNA hydrolase
MKLIVGLGNYGKEYENTRHNVGFMVADNLADKLDTDITKKDFKGLIAKFKYKNEDIIILKPLTYMNLSGESVIEVVKYYNIDIKDIVVIFDDLDLEVGKVRLREKGGSGGHNGAKSIIELLHSEEFKRIRIGIGKNEFIKGPDYVLGKFNKDEQKLIMEAISKASDALICYLNENFEIAMNKFN